MENVLILKVNTERVCSLQQMQIPFYFDQLLQTLQMLTGAIGKFVHGRSCSIFTILLC